MFEVLCYVMVIWILGKWGRGRNSFDVRHIGDWADALAKLGPEGANNNSRFAPPFPFPLYKYDAPCVLILLFNPPPPSPSFFPLRLSET